MLENIDESPDFMIRWLRWTVLRNMQSIDGRRPTARFALGTLVFGIALALLGQFVLDSLADRGDFFHQLQHGLLFAGGIAVGAACLSLYRFGQRPA